MTKGFILRFQESCVSVQDAAIQSGTQTKTAIKAESPDSDPGIIGYGALVVQTPYAGTKTATAIKTEAADADQSFSASNLGISRADCFYLNVGGCMQNP